MGTPVGAELSERITSDRSARLDKPVRGSVTLGKIPLQPHPKAAWVELFPVEPISADKARKVARWFLGNCQDIGTDTSDTAILVVSELVTNACIAMTEKAAGISCVELSLRLFNDRLLIEVTDSSPRMPVLKAGGPDAINGRGLSIVNELSHQWGYFWHRGRKVVYVVLSVTDSANATSAWSS